VNALTIADALATKYASLTVSPVPSGMVGGATIRQSTARVPNKIPTSPFVTVFLPEGEMVMAPQWVDYALHFRVTFHYAKHSADLARDVTGMLAWLGVMLAATWSGMSLGVTGVKKAYATAFRFVIAEWGGDEWYGWEITVRVDYGESQAMVP
jgi:hypothetical protein